MSLVRADLGGASTSTRRPAAFGFAVPLLGLCLLPLMATAATGALDRIKAAKTITVAYASNAY
ncbi:MAG: hypothetical protein WBG92_19385, partial [Thiohalocapsa sp.]